MNKKALLNSKKARILVPALMALYGTYAIVNTGFADAEFSKAMNKSARHAYYWQKQDKENDYTPSAVATWWAWASQAYSAYAACIRSHSALIYPAWMIVSRCTDLHPTTQQRKWEVLSG